MQLQIVREKSIVSVLVKVIISARIYSATSKQLTTLELNPSCLCKPLISELIQLKPTLRLQHLSMFFADIHPDGCCDKGM
jgi:hypothetical protein